MRLLRNIQAVLTILCGLFLLLGAFSHVAWIPYVSVICGSYFAITAAIESLRDRTLDVNFLMVFAAIGAVAIGRPEDAAALLFLFSLSSTLEAYAMTRTKSAIEGLIKLRPDKALRVTADGEERVPVEALKIGDHVRIPPFENIPADGNVVQGRSSVNQSAMTGESIPVERVPGDMVLAGTQNQEGMLLVSVTAEVGSTALEKIVHLVRDAQENKASGERISSWFGHRYTIFVVSAFAVSLVVRLLLGVAASSALYSSLVLFVGLSPCALVISTPATTLSALAWAARKGILIRGGEFIELAGRVNCLAIDKTGTLTQGRPKLVEICVCSHSEVSVGGGKEMCLEEESCWRGGPEMSDEAIRMLRAAAAAEQYSSHPIAEAIVLAAREHGIEVPEAFEQQDHSGLGVTARIDEGLVKVGQPRFFQLEGETLTEEFTEHMVELQGRGMTVAVLEFNGKMAALGLRDEPRAEAGPVLAEMQGLGVSKVVMLTGDTIQTATAVADQLHISDVNAALLPADKTQLIESLEENGSRVMFVGDGINDAPSLARASVGVAMGGLGSDVALNAADIVLMQDKLERLPQIVRLGRSTNRIIRTNLFFAGGVIVTLATLALVTKLPLPVAVVGHEGSTVLVILNGLRLLRGPR